MKLVRAQSLNDKAFLSLRSGSEGVWQVAGTPFVISRSLYKSQWTIMLPSEYPFTVGLHNQQTQWLHKNGLRRDNSSVHFPTRARALDALALAWENDPP